MSTPDASAPQMLSLSHGQTRLRLAGPQDGPRVLLVHGMTYPLEVWDQLSQDLAQAGFRVARFDLYGRGEATWSGHPLGPEALAAQAVEVQRSLSWLSPVPWVSLSNSDLILLAAARLSPDSCKSLSLIAPSGFDPRLMNLRVRILSRMPGCARWLGSRLKRTCITRMKRHRQLLDPEMVEQSGPIYERSIHWAETNSWFSSAVISQIRHLPTHRELKAQLATPAAQTIPIHALRFGDEKDSTDEGLAPFLNAVSQASISFLAQGSHMGLLEHSGAVSSWVLKTLC